MGTSYCDGLANRLSLEAFAAKNIRLLPMYKLLATVIVLCHLALYFQFNFVLQKRAICSNYNLNIKKSLKDKFKKINILTFASLYILENALYMKKYS